MRIRSIHLPLLLLVLFFFAYRTTAQKDAEASNTKVEKQSDTERPPAIERENWGDLKDLKTGLRPQTADTLEVDEQPGFVRQLVRVEWRMHDPIDLWIIRPKIPLKVPVILYLYSYDDNGPRFRDNGWGMRVASGGFAAVGFVSALTDYRFRFRPLRQWFVSELPEALGTTVHDVQLILNYLAGRGDMDMDRVGMFGMGSGASIAILAAYADPRIKTLDLLDPWGDWPDWLKQSPLISDDERGKFLTPEFLKSVARLDPIAYLPSLKTLNLRLQQTLSDPSTPKVAKERLAAALTNPDELVKYTDARDLLKAWETSGLSGWIKQQIRPQISKSNPDGALVAPTGTDSTPSESVSRGEKAEREMTHE